MKDTIPALCLLTLISCGKSSSGSGQKMSPPQEQQDMVQSVGEFRALLRPYNIPVSGWIPSGVAEISIQDNEIEVKSLMDDAANTVHLQNIYLGTSCPTMSADTNSDGFIDAVETTRVLKGVILPLDGDLSSQSEGSMDQPKGAAYTYLRKANLSDTLEDLWKADENPNDHFIKLKSGLGLGIEGRVIIVHGAAVNRKFPSTVAGFSGMTVQQSMPIACGVIEKMPQRVDRTYP
jgi:hypothetical protein